MYSCVYKDMLLTLKPRGADIMELQPCVKQCLPFLFMTVRIKQTNKQTKHVHKEYKAAPGTW